MRTQISRHNSIQALARLWCIVAMALLPACQSAGVPANGPLERETVSHLFLPVETVAAPAPTVAMADMFNTPVSAISIAPTMTPSTEAATPAALQMVFDDHLYPGWSLAQSWDMAIDAANQQPVRCGSHSLRATPLKANGAMFVTNADPARAYLRDDYQALRFMLHGGEKGLTLEDLAVTVLGSNARPDFDPNDDSVEVDEDLGPFFSETRLYFLGFNRGIPPDTWVTVEVVLDELPYDPDYTYITGFYIKNDEAYRGTFYVDDIALIRYGG